MIRKCYKCKVEKALDQFPTNRTKKEGKDYVCKVCSRKRDREYSKRMRQTEWARDKDRKRYEKIKSDPVALAKFQARQKARIALKKGKIKKKNCLSCRTNKNLHMHHTDYSKPLQVIWLCKDCHFKEHYGYPLKDNPN